MIFYMFIIVFGLFFGFFFLDYLGIMNFEEMICDFRFVEIEFCKLELS